MDYTGVRILILLILFVTSGFVIFLSAGRAFKLSYRFFENVRKFLRGKKDVFYIREEIEDIAGSSKAFSLFEQYFMRKSVLILITAVVVFVFHLWLQWTFQKDYIIGDMLYIVVRPFNFLIYEGIPDMFFHTHSQVNSYTGNPFFLLPFVYALGYTPDAFRIVLFGVIALTNVVFSLIYYEVLDFKKQILGVLILTSMSTWVFFWWPDYDYSTLFFGILLMLYVRWVNEGATAYSRYLYVMSFLGGLFFYFKATVAYMGIAFGVATLYQKRGSIINFVKSLNIPVLIVLFLVGLSPFLTYNYFQDRIMSDGFSFAGPEETNFGDVAVERFYQLDKWTATEAGNLSLISSFSDLSNPFNFFTVLLLLSMAVLAIKRQKLYLPIIFAVFYALLLFLPTISSVRAPQMTVLTPLIPLIVLTAFESVTKRFESTNFYRIGFVLACAIFAASIFSGVSSMDSPANPENEEAVDLWYWSGSQQFYDDFKKLDVEGPIVTNSYKVHLITRYTVDINLSDFLIPAGFPEDTEKLKSKLWEEGPPREGPQVDTTDYYRVSVDEWMKGDHSPVETSETVTLLLRENQVCTPREEFCGAAVDEVLDEFNLTRDQMQRTTLTGNSYLVMRNVTLAP